MTIIKKTTMAVGLLLLSCTGVLAWETTDQTKVADDGTLLVAKVSEEGDMLGTPWLAHLKESGYDTSGDWWVDTAGTLIDYNQDLKFAPGTFYGIYPGEKVWFPAPEKLVTTVSASSGVEPTVVEADTAPSFEVLMTEFASAAAADIATIQAYQKEVEADFKTRFEKIEETLGAQAERLKSVDNQLGSLDASLDAWRTDVDTAAEERERIQQQIETEAVAREAADTLLQTEVAAGKQIGQNAHETAISASNGVLAAIKRSNELTDALHDTSLLVNTNANDIASVRDDMETADATLREDMETADAALRGDLDSLTEQGGLHWLTILTAIAVLGVAGGLGWLIWKRRKDRKEKEEEKNLLKDLEGDVKQLKAEIENHHVLAEKHQDVVASAITLNTEGGVLVSTDDLGNTSATVDSPIEVVASVGSQEFEVVNFWRNSDTPPGSVECDLLRDDKGRVVGRISASKAKGSLARAISAGRLPEKTVSP